MYLEVLNLCSQSRQIASGRVGGGRGSDRPDTLAVLTPIGLLVGRVVLSYAGPVPPDNALVETRMIPYPAEGSGASEGEAEVPVGVALTEHHYVLAYPHRLVALSRITLGVAFSQHLPEDKYGSVRGVVLDPTYFDPSSADTCGASGSLSTCQVGLGGVPVPCVGLYKAAPTL